jgi:hypothetical protein
LLNTIKSSLLVSPRGQRLLIQLMCLELRFAVQDTFHFICEAEIFVDIANEGVNICNQLHYSPKEVCLRRSLDSTLAKRIKNIQQRGFADSHELD